MTRFKYLVVLLPIVFTSFAYAGGDVAEGKEKSQACVACHGENGVSPNAQFPVIAGQYKDYLFNSMMDYKTGQRKNPVMAGIVAALDEQDFHDLAAYYSSLEGLDEFELSAKY